MRQFIFLLLATVAFNYSTKGQNPGIDKGRVTQFFENQEFEEAIAYLTTAYSSDSLNLQVLGYLGYAHYMNDNMKLAEKYFLKMYMIDANQLNAARYLSIIYQNKRPETAVLFTSRMIQLQPDRPTNYRTMGELLKRLNERDSAMKYYVQAYAMAPEDYRTVAGFVELLLDKKNYGKADSVLKLALAKDSLNVPLLRLSVRSDYEKKDYEKTVVSGEKLITLGETPLTALTQVTLAYYNLGKYHHSIRVCQYMRNNDIDIESVYYYEAKAWSKLKEYNKSNELLEICIDKAISETAENYYYSIGQNYESLKLYKKAISAYDTAYYLFRDPIMHYNIGAIYDASLKNPPMAKRFYTRYLDMAKPVTAEEKRAVEYVRSILSKEEAKENK